MKRLLRVGDRIEVRSGLFPAYTEEVVSVEGNRAMTNRMRVFHRRVWYRGSVYLYRRPVRASQPDFRLVHETEMEK